MILFVFAAIVFIFGFVVFRGAPYVPSLKKYAKRAFDELHPLTKKMSLLMSARVTVSYCGLQQAKVREP